MDKGTVRVKTGFAEMFKGGVIMDVTTPEQARVAEEAGATAVMALERVPADIRVQGGVARMSDPTVIKKIIDAVSIPVMAKARIGHFVEAMILEALGVDFIDESEVLTPADEEHHIDKWTFKVPFVCGARDLGEALRRVGEGAAMIRTKGEAGTGNVVEAVRHARTVQKQIRWLEGLRGDELMDAAKQINAPFDLGFLAAELEITRLPLPDNLVIDTLTLARRVYSFSSNGLSAVAASLGLGNNATHRAMDDVRTTCAVLERILLDLERRWGITKLGELIEFQGGSISYPHVRALPLPPTIA
ncbi:MAG: exonuclease domain-containing protein, partial [Acidobacteriota bacterium]